MKKFIVSIIFILFFLCSAIDTQATVTITSPQNNATYSINNIPLNWNSVYPMVYCLFSLNGVSYYDFPICYSGTATGVITLYEDYHPSTPPSQRDTYYFNDVEIDSKDNILVLNCNQSTKTYIIDRYNRDIGTREYFNTNAPCDSNTNYVKPAKITRWAGTSTINLISCAVGKLQHYISNDDGENWSFVTNITNCTYSWAYYITSSLDAVTDATGKLHIVFENTSSRVNYVTNKNGSWVFTYIQGEPITEQHIPAITERNGKICAGWGRTAMYPYYVGVSFAYYNGSDWFIGTNNTYTSDNFGQSCVVFDNNDNCYVGLVADQTILWKVNQTGSSRYVMTFSDGVGCSAERRSDGKLWIANDGSMRLFSPSTDSIEQTFGISGTFSGYEGGTAIDKWDIPVISEVSAIYHSRLQIVDIPLYPLNTNFNAEDGQNNLTLFYTESGGSFESQSILFQVGGMSDLLGLVCGAGSSLTGTTLEGGCLVASLFILAIALSIIGWILKVLELEYKTTVPNKYFVSGMVSLALIVAFVVIGLCDIITGFISFFMILAILIVYEENVVSK